MAIVGFGGLGLDNSLTTSSTSDPHTHSKKLRFIDMNASTGGVARGTAIGTTETTIYLYNGSGIIHAFLINMEEKDNWLVKFQVDTEDIFTSAGILASDLKDHGAYDIDHDHDEESELFGIRYGRHEKFIWNGPNALGIRYSSSVRVIVKRVSGKPSKAFRAGLVVLTQET